MLLIDIGSGKPLLFCLLLLLMRLSLNQGTLAANETQSQ
jgi:hypothetical protein